MYECGYDRMFQVVSRRLKVGANVPCGSRMGSDHTD